MVPYVFEVRDNVTIADPETQKNYAKITAIRVQDVNRGVWYSWDDPARAWNKQPEFRAGTGLIYIAFYAVNTKPAAAKVTLTLYSPIEDKIIARKEEDVNAGAGVGVEVSYVYNSRFSVYVLHATFAPYMPELISTPEPTPGPTPTPIMPPIEIPDLPWYASWLTPIIQYIANYGQSVMNYVFSSLNPIMQAADSILKLPKILGEDSVHIAALSMLQVTTSRNAITDAIAGQLPGLTRLINPETYFAPNTADNEIAAKFPVWWSEANTILNILNLTAWSAELATLGQVEAGIKFVDSTLDVFPLKGLMGRVSTAQLEAAWVKPIQRQINAKWLPERPDVNELINEVVKEVLTVEQFIDIMKGQGFAPEWSQRIWDAHFVQPAFQQLQRSYWRGYIKYEELPHYLKLFDLDPRYNEKLWMPLFEEIPPFPELINERVKEVTTQDQFEKGLAGWGFKGEWAKRIWDAHFVPATWMDFLTAMRRKLSVTIPVAEGAPQQHTFGADATRDIEIVKGLSVLADYDPRYWDFFKTRIYNDPSPRMSMWAYDAGAIDDVQMREIVHRYGYTPDAEAWFGDMLIKFQERPWVTRYLTALQTAYIDEAITAEELEKRVIAIPRNKNIAAWMVKIADVRKEILAAKPSAASQKLLTASDLRAAYMLNIIDTDKLRAELLLQGYQLSDIEILVELVNEQKQAVVEGGMKKGLTISELFDAMRYEFKTEEQVQTELMLRGMALDDAQTLIKTRKAKWVMGGQVPGGD
jgi:hypothetical protein